MARGSITPRPTKDGKIRYRIKWETRGPDGKRKHHSATRRTRDEAEKYLAKRLGEVHEGTFIVPSKETVEVYLKRRLDASAPDWSEATLYQYRYRVRLLQPLLGHCPFATLDELTIQHCYAKLIAEGYAPETVAGTHRVLHAAFAQAVAWRLLQRNPADGVRVPARPSMAPARWTADEAAACLAATTDDPLAALWRLGLDSGMRVGEMLALAWADLDVAQSTVSVRRTLTRTAAGGWKIGEHAKNASSRRAIRLATATVAALRARRVPQNERRLACGPAWVDCGLIFDRGNGEWMNPARIRERFAGAVARVGVSPLTPHGMRHTMATLMLEAGVHPKIVQERLGHRSIQMTLDRYSHVSMTMQTEAAELLGSILAGEARPGRGHEAR
jgi:integrase